MLKEIHNFLEVSSIHGLAYLGRSQTRSTRGIWTIIVLTAATFASYFLYQTITGYEKKYTSTTIEARSIKKYPFPAVTFHPGEYSSRNDFLKRFLNQFEFTRYHKNNLHRDNKRFLELFHWLVSPINDNLFNNIEKKLI